jgi:hypothetical protein
MLNRVYATFGDVPASSAGVEVNASAPIPRLNAEPFRARCRAKRGGGVVLRREAQAAIAREVRALLALRVRASPPVKDGPTVDGDQPPERGVGL